MARLSHELYSFMKEKGINPITNAGLPIIQVSNKMNVGIKAKNILTQYALIIK